MSETSEEKELPPSSKKLSDARKKGQIAHSRDMVTAVTTVAVFVYLLLAAERIGQDCIDLLRLPLDLDAANVPFDTVMEAMLLATVSLAAQIVLPPIGIVIGVGIVTNVLANGGPVFALEPIQPKLENLDPIAGLKRIYGARSMVEFGKSLVKALLLGVVLTILILAGLNTLVRIPGCGLTCLPVALDALTTPLIGAAAAIFLAIGLVDVLLQNWLFERDMKMTKTEAKREQIDQNGNPQIRGAHQRLRREIAESAKVGIGQATLLIAGSRAAVGLRYVSGETPVPMVVCRAVGEAADALVRDARKRQVPVVVESRLATFVAGKARPGANIPSKVFADVARAILKAQSAR